ncbi:MAG: MG2 domain-containing protein, partial [Myxococcota bacterium]|nr:MG2 domain-containing protein [Myxococcota bacterium]
VGIPPTKPTPTLLPSLLPLPQFLPTLLLTPYLFTILLTLSAAACTNTNTAPTLPKPPNALTVEVFPPPLQPFGSAPAAPELGKLELVRYAPIGRTEQNPLVRVRFSLAMHTLGAASERCDVDILRFEPPIDGTQCWEGNSLLRFTPSEPFPIGNRYTVTVAPGIHDASGTRQLEQAPSWSFETPRPQLDSAEPYHDAIDITRDSSILLRFNAPVDAQSLRPFVKLWAAEPDRPERVDEVSACDNYYESCSEARYLSPGALDFELSAATGDDCEPQQCLRLRPKKLLPPAAKITLQVDPGFVSTQGPLPAELPFESSFIARDLMRLVEVSCPNGICRPDEWVSFRFSRPFAPIEKIEPYISVRPKVDLYISDWYDRVQFWGDFAPNTEYTISFASGLRDNAEQRLAPFQFSFKTGPFLPSLGLPTGLTYIDRRGPHGLVAEIRHSNSHRAVIAPIPQDKLIPTLTWLSQDHDACSSDADCCVGQCDPEAQQCTQEQRGCRVLPSSIATPSPVTLRSQRVLETLELALPIAELVPESQPGAVFYSVHTDEDVSVTGLLVLSALGLTLRSDGERAVVLLSDLASAEPIANVEVELRDADNQLLWQSVSDQQGFAELPPSQFPDSPRPLYVVARQGEDVALLALPHANPRDDRLAGSLLTDRRLYKTGERLFFKGFPRLDSVAGTQLPGGELELTLNDAQGRELHKLKLEPNARGNVHGELSIPIDARLGWATLTLRDPKGRGSLSTQLRIATYRAPEFEVLSTPVREEICRGEPIEVSVVGKLLNGALMPDAPGLAVLSGTERGFYPQGPVGVSFGYIWPQPMNSAYNGRLDIQTDAQGQTVARFDTSVGFYAPVTYTVNAELSDVARQTVASSANVLVHPGEFYLGVRIPSPEGYNRFIVGDSFEASFVAVHPDGSLFTELSHIRDLRLRITGPRQYPPAESDPGYEAWLANPPQQTVRECIPDNLESAELLGRCGVRFDQRGTWHVSAIAFDSRGNKLRVEESVSVYEDRNRVGTMSEKRCDGLRPDKPLYQPGDTAKLEYCSYHHLSTGFFTVERGGIQSYYAAPIALDARRTEFELPLTTAQLPRVELGLSSIGQRRGYELSPDGYDDGKPQWEQRRSHIELDLDAQRLELSLVPERDVVTPGSDVSLSLSVRDASGKGVQSELTVWAVDEGVLLLEPLILPDLVASLFPQRWSRVAVAELRAYLASKLGMTTPERLQQLLAGLGASGSGLGGGGSSGHGAAIRAGNVSLTPPPIRSRFETTPLFLAELETDANGNATAVLKLPDNLTRFKLIAIANATSDSAVSAPEQRELSIRFGSAESSVTVQQPLMLRPALPRFVHLGDRFDAGVIVQNATDRDRELTVKVSLGCDAASDCVLVDGAMEQRLTVPANRAVELPFAFRANALGKARFDFEVFGAALPGATPAGPLGDAVSLTLPVQQKLISEATAVYGRIDDTMSDCCDPSDALGIAACAACTTAVAIPLAIPREVDPERGGLQLRMASTALTGL